MFGTEYKVKKIPVTSGDCFISFIPVLKAGLHWQAADGLSEAQSQQGTSTFRKVVLKVTTACLSKEGKYQHQIRIIFSQTRQILPSDRSGSVRCSVEKTGYGSSTYQFGQQAGQRAISE
jgi:hypothetical protein